jgi:hypothetical protein
MFPQLMSTHLTQAGEVLQQEAMDFGGWDRWTSVSRPKWGPKDYILLIDAERQGYHCCSSWFLVFSRLPSLFCLYLNKLRASIIWTYLPAKFKCHKSGFLKFWHFSNVTFRSW